MYESLGHCNSEPPLEQNQDQTLLVNQCLLWPFQATWNLSKHYAVSY